MAKIPFDYSSVILFDELELRAYDQLMEKAQPTNAFESLNYSKIIQDLTVKAETNRRALFTRESIAGSFGVIKQIYNTGWYGRILAFLLRNLGINPHK